MSFEITYSGHPAVLEGYSDSNWTQQVGMYLLMEVAQCHAGLASKPY
jgi:hypothetical protein